MLLHSDGSYHCCWPGDHSSPDNRSTARGVHFPALSSASPSTASLPELPASSRWSPPRASDGPIPSTTEGERRRRAPAPPARARRPARPRASPAREQLNERARRVRGRRPSALALDAAARLASKTTWSDLDDSARSARSSHPLRGSAPRARRPDRRGAASRVCASSARRWNAADRSPAASSSSSWNRTSSGNASSNARASAGGGSLDLEQRVFGAGRGRLERFRASGLVERVERVVLVDHRVIELLSAPTQRVHVKVALLLRRRGLAQRRARRPPAQTFRRARNRHRRNRVGSRGRGHVPTPRTHRVAPKRAVVVLRTSSPRRSTPAAASASPLPTPRRERPSSRVLHPEARFLDGSIRARTTDPPATPAGPRTRSPAAGRRAHASSRGTASGDRRQLSAATASLRQHSCRVAAPAQMCAPNRVVVVSSRAVTVASEFDRWPVSERAPFDRGFRGETGFRPRSKNSHQRDVFFLPRRPDRGRRGRRTSSALLKTRVRPQRRPFCIPHSVRSARFVQQQRRFTRLRRLYKTHRR